MTCHCAHDHRLVNGKDCSSDPRCPEGTKPCLSEDICLPLEQFCNGVADCPDHSDENCEESQNPTFWLTFLNHLSEEKVSFTNNVHYADAGEHFCSIKKRISWTCESHVTFHPQIKREKYKITFFHNAYNLDGPKNIHNFILGHFLDNYVFMMIIHFPLIFVIIIKILSQLKNNKVVIKINCEVLS